MRQLLVISMILLPLVSGCVFGNERIRDEVDTIAWDLRPMELEPQVELQIGRGLLGMVSTVARWSDDHDAEFVADFLDEVDAVDLGIYTLHGPWHEGPDGLTTDAIEELRDLGWRVVVRTREHRDGDRWILYRGEPGHDQMLAIGFEDYLEADGITAIEWAERGGDLIPPSAIQVWMQALDAPNEREIRIG